jgi:hypothetical protein
VDEDASESCQLPVRETAMPNNDAQDPRVVEKQAARAKADELFESAHKYGNLRSAIETAADGDPLKAGEVQAELVLLIREIVREGRG